MYKKYLWVTLLPILFLAFSLGCGQPSGQVEQGRVIAADKAKKTITLIRDVKHELGNPVYDQLPPLTFELPKNPAEMGPEPKAGKLMEVDPKAKEIVIFDDASQNFKRIKYNPIDEKEGVGLRNPLVAGKTFPVVDRAKKTVTVYDKRKRLITTFALPEEFFTKPDNTFGFGDEVRIYAKLPGKALRLMNISETDIFKK
ncbi:MAG: DUF4881 domain-containing protein [Syntrophales bacterium]|nr:DUF4881 domain-containing protein [Syntrophales bacterium]MDD5641955.1 DUF4881 domain-containing protein [Syntrophales bacterium]